jgi:Ca2+-transporting ATPase
MMDPPREEAVEAIRACRRAGIRIIMVTGDHVATASAIAAKVSLAAEPIRSMSGQELEKLPDEEFARAAREVSVFARVDPGQKLRLVNTLREQGEIVAVTGDGVNDAPALKSAHIGAAMGRSGTDVAKEASEMVLTDDDFATIYAAVEEGRTAFSNIRKATFFLISSGAAELLAILTSIALRMPLPLVPVQILWLNVVTNGVQDVALAFEPGEEDLFRRPPRDPKEGVLSRLFVERTALVGIVMAAGTLGIFAWEANVRGLSDEYARVAALSTMVMFQVFHVFNSRSENLSILKKSPRTNPFLLVGTTAALLIHIGATFFGPTQFLLDLEPLDPLSWLLLTVTAFSVVLAVEAHKRLRAPA